jgi:hypothetical protein
MNFNFNIEECTNNIVSVIGLGPTDKLILYRLACVPDCPPDVLPDSAFIEFNPNGCQTFIDTLHNPLFVDVPGRYQLRFEGATNPDVDMCITTYRRHCDGTGA